MLILAVDAVAINSVLHNDQVWDTELGKPENELVPVIVKPVTAPKVRDPVELSCAQINLNE